jgi:hyaluronan synthase/N-acetylglucosaminyltransferase
MSSALTIYFVIYGALALGHLAVQTLFAHLDFRRQRKDAHHHGTGIDFVPFVSLVVTIYNEDLDVLHRCLRSIDHQDYPYLEVFVVDDRSSKLADPVDVLEEFQGGRFRIMLSEQNRGKRAAQRSVLDEVRGDVIMTTDSDTIIPRDGIRALVAPFAKPSVGAVTGDVKVTNKHQNLLTRLISYRYWSAFNQERAAQSYFNVVMCCSGPLAAYRRTVVDSVKDAYVSQAFLGHVCTFGDDRHMTNLILDAGYDVEYVNAATAETQAPTTIGKYLRQQVRWNKSFYREMIWTLKFAHRKHPYMAVDLVLQALLPFMLMFALGAMAYQAAVVDISHLGRYAVMLVGIALLRSAYGVYRTRDLGFLLFVAYGFLHVFLLIPTRLYALATIRRTHWGTRTSTPVPVPRPGTLASPEIVEVDG